YNLIAGTLSSLCHYSNREKSVNRITPGIHGISNAFLNTPWPKVERAKKRFSELIQNGKLTENELFHLLSDQERFPPEQLPDTGLEPELERAVSSCFIKTADYGTRCSTLLFVTHHGEVRFVERVFAPGTNNVTEENGYDFRFRDS
ncbi:MAG: NRDE family protein, partial [Balneolaceae bacterium]